MRFNSDVIVEVEEEEMDIGVFIVDLDVVSVLVVMGVVEVVDLFGMVSLVGDLFNLGRFELVMGEELFMFGLILGWFEIFVLGGSSGSSNGFV